MVRRVASTREYRERALARRLDRDGARLEQYTKKQKLIPVGDTVVVQNQTGRFPKKWDKTGVVVENMDHDKVLVRMDGSRRLTTRNRRFVRKILSPPDLPDQDMQSVPSSPVQKNTSVSAVGAIVDEAPMALVDADILDDVSGSVGMQQGVGQYEAEIREEMINDGVQDDVGGSDVQPLLPVQSGTKLLPAGGRPKRKQRPNVKYSSEEYDLSKVSASRTNLVLSGLYVQQCRHRHRGRYQEKSRRL